MSQIHFTIYCQFSPPSPPYNVHCSLPIVHSHGARYYQPNLSIWLSVDPMADKYPGLSPYTYCANNPVRLVDPDGEEVYIIGDSECANKATAQLCTDNLTISRDAKTGKLSVIGDAQTTDEKKLVAAINSSDVTVRVIAHDSEQILGEFPTNGGSFAGVILKEDGNITTAIATQYVNPKMLAAFDKEEMSLVGQTMKHEITEDYYAGVLSLKKHKPAPPAFSFLPNRLKRTYLKAHNLAIPQAWATEEQIEQRKIAKKAYEQIQNSIIYFPLIFHK